MAIMSILTQPTCPRCGGHDFGMKSVSVQNAMHAHYFIMCATCGCVVGTESAQSDEGFSELQQMLHRQAYTMDRLLAQLNEIDRKLMMLSLKMR